MGILLFFYTLIFGEGMATIQVFVYLLYYIMSLSSNKVSLIRNIANHLRGWRKQYEYQKVILPLIIIKRLNDVLAPTKEKVLDQYKMYSATFSDEQLHNILTTASGYGFYNISAFDFKKLLADPKHIADNLKNLIAGFSDNMKEIIGKFEFDTQLKKLKDGDLLYLILSELNKPDLNFDLEHVSNMEMGYIFEELIRKFAEQSNETAWEHYTPREVIELMVKLLLAPDMDSFTDGIIKTVYDPCCGTGGMLTVAKDEILKHNSKAQVHLYGQELNPETYAICKADMLIKGEKADNIKWGEEEHTLASTLSNDQHSGQTFDYILSNPPYGVEWKKDKTKVDAEAERWMAGRFWAGTPRISDGQLLFLQHMISKINPIHKGGSRVAVVFNGSPLFTGDAGSGESEIRRWILENDLLEGIVALPEQLFYNTGISTYIRILTNRKDPADRGQVKLMDARSFYKKMRKSLGSKRHEISDDDLTQIVKHYYSDKSEYLKVFKTTDFGYRQITIEQAAKEEDGSIIVDKKWNPKPDTSLRDSENVPLGEDIQEYFKREVKPYLPDAWISEESKYRDHKDGQIGKIWYEINFTRYFYTYTPPRSLEAIEADILEIENSLTDLVRKLTA